MTDQVDRFRSAGTYARFALFDEDVAVDADLDLCVYHGADLAGTSASGTSAEEISFPAPTGRPIPLTVYVHGWGVPTGFSLFALHEFYVPATDSAT